MLLPIVIAIDFDGTIVSHEYPRIGEPIPHAIRVIQALSDHGHTLILYTMRSGKRLEEAKQYCLENGLRFHYYNENPSQKSWTTSPKVLAEIYIDDAAATDFVYPHKNGRYAVDWMRVEAFLKSRGHLV